MPYTTTHVLVAIILIEIFREYFFKKKYQFPRYYILIAAFAAIIPDIEYLFMLPSIHVGFLHSIFTPLILFLTGLIILKFDIKHKEIRKRHMKLSVIFFILAAGSFLHILMDFFITDGSSLIYPFIKTNWGLNLIDYVPIPKNIALIGLNTILLFFWIFWMEFKLKIDDYF